ncbi:serine/threonine-protein kinase [Lysobacter capsici]|uniref:serine/threonine-protein kinase n=1 Tax=Lysobacter capsici TaxID=435897 RepID=UPI0006275522|nr:serine/threonine-protein kinase [Lysobacter capsici]
MDRARYDTKSTLGAGGFGSVIEIRDKYLERDVLYKSMHDPANNDQLIREVSALVHARSRHIIEIYDLDIDANGNLVGIIIEKLTGRDFQAYHLGATADLDAYTRIVYQLAAALADLHDANVIHRDIKLDNFKESSAGIVKLFDFGIASTSGTHKTTQHRGTPLYAAPELYERGADITSASDIYSLGVCCWTLLTAATPAALTAKPPLPGPSLSTVAPHLSPELTVFIDRCLAKNPTERPSASELRDACERTLLRDKHKGIFYSTRRNEVVYELSASAQNVKITIANLGELRAIYSGTEFVVTGTSGDVYINNQTVGMGTRLHDACVITFGNFLIGADREYISFICSKPEIVL